MNRWLIALAFLVTAGVPCQAQDRAQARATTDLTAYSLGDRITFTVEVEHAADQLVSWPAMTDTLGSFELVDIVPGESLVSENRRTSVMHYMLTTFELGDLEIPEIEVSVAGADSSEVQLLTTRPVRILVESVGIDETGDIRTVKAPLEIPRNWLLLLPWVLLIAGVVAIGYWLYRKYQKREVNTGTVDEPALPARPPHEIAYEALARLDEKRLLERGEIKQYFIEVSEIIRAYLEGRYRVDALEMTSYEVLCELQTVGLDSAVYDLFPPFFDRSDLVKFAKHRPAENVCSEMIPMARRLVDETRAREEVHRPDDGVDGKPEAPESESAKVEVG